MDRADQEDQNRWDELGEEEFSRRQRERRERVAEIVAAGELRTALDYHHASWLLQHGQVLDDYLLAHLLASVAAFEKEKSAYFMTAAGLDRFLEQTGRPQRFGSQSYDEAGQDLGDTSQLLAEPIVSVFLGGSTGLHGRPVGQRERRTLKDASRRLSLAAREAQKRPIAPRAGPPDDDKVWREMLLDTRRLVDAGLLDEAGDYYNAAVVLLRDPAEESLLLAHILATAAGVLQHRKFRPVFQQSLDAFLIAMGRRPVFGSEVPAGVDLEAGDPLLDFHPRIRSRLDGKG